MHSLEREKQFIARDFDVAYYRNEYPDIDFPSEMMVDHFCERGWREGRNPSPYFDTVTYLITNGDVAANDLNPYFHYLFYGLNEGRSVSQAATPSVRTNIFFGYGFVDWVARIRPHLDEAFYAAYLPAAMLGNIDLAAHFAYRGWREGLSPSSKFDIRQWSRHYPEAKRLLVNPLLIRLEEEKGTFIPRRKETVAQQPVAPTIPTLASELSATTPAEDRPTTAIDEAVIDLVRAGFSPDYYLSQNPDVKAAGIDPVMHYLHEGWKEGRNPNKEFDTAYYLAANQDVAAAGLNPFWHFLAEGRREGRQPCRPGGHRRRTIDAARPPEQRAEEYILPVDEQCLDAAGVAGIENALAAAEAGVVVALSHDCYVKSVGGTQIFISDEQSKFNAAGYTYLHISPMIPRLALAPTVPEFVVRVVLDGAFLGLCPIDALSALLARWAAPSDTHTTLVIHSVFGFNGTVISKLQRVLEFARCILLAARLFQPVCRFQPVAQRR